jgi:hypothetical protein
MLPSPPAYLKPEVPPPIPDSYPKYAISEFVMLVVPVALFATVMYGLGSPGITLY